MARKEKGNGGQKKVAVPGKGGRSKIVVHDDAHGGKLLQLSVLVDTLGNLFQGSFVEKEQYASLRETKNVFQLFKAFLRTLSDVNEDQAKETMFRFLGAIIKMARQASIQDKTIESLELRNEALSEAVLRKDSTEKIKSSASELMDALVEHLSLCHMEFQDLMKEYQELVESLQEDKEQVESELDQFEVLLLSFLDGQKTDSLKAALFFPSSHLSEFEAKLDDFQRSKRTDEQKKELSDQWTTLEKNSRWISELEQKLVQTISKVSRHLRNIEMVKDKRGDAIKKQLLELQQEIRKIEVVFKTLSKEALFWGCVYGLHEVVQYTPTDLLALRVDTEERNLPGEELTRYLEKHIRVEQALQACVSESTPGVLETEQVQETTSSANRVKQITDMTLCVLWGFINDFLEKAEAEGKTVQRKGDYGRMPRVVAKLLEQTEHITKREKKIVTETAIKTLAAEGMLLLKPRMAPTRKYKSGEKSYTEQIYVVLTDAGRTKGQELLLSHQEMMTAVLKRQAERIAHYNQNRSPNK
ncbi:hypothetical protein HQ571_06580 [Candidatus Kuenenbacteria bacterium]|nr:hypothetical protein [Candidatus Kuenenbacteria bacterium]